MKRKQIYIIIASLILIGLIGTSIVYAKDSCSFDKNPPVISGAEDIELELGKPLIDLLEDITIVDDCDSNPSIMVDHSHVNLNEAGQYPIIYYASDQYGNSSHVKVYATVKDDVIDPQLIGVENLTFEVGTEVTDVMLLENVVAKDNKIGIITDLIRIDRSQLKTNEVGEYTIYYEVEDTSQNKVVADAVITMVDTTAPVIEITDEDLTFNVFTDGVNWKDYFTVTDNYDEHVKVTIDSDAVKLDEIGNYDVIIEAEDDYGNKEEATLNVSIKDLSSPVIEFLNQIQIDVFSSEASYLDFISVNDNFDRSPSIEIDDSNVNLDVVGTYEITLTVSDLSNNITTEMITVEVVDRVAPVFETTNDFIYIVGANIPDYLENIVISDNYDTLVSLNTVIVNDDYVNYNKRGTYPLIYKVYDSSLNEATKIVNVYVDYNDTLPPKIENIRDIHISTHNLYPDYYHEIKVRDDIDGDLTKDLIVIHSDVIYGVVGEYTLYYYVSDHSGNTVFKTATLYIEEDTEKPIIDGFHNRTIKKGDLFNPLYGIKAFDNFDGDVTSRLMVISDYDVDEPGEYTIKIKARDTSGNSRVVSYTLTVKGDNNLYFTLGIVALVVSVLGIATYFINKKFNEE